MIRRIDPENTFAFGFHDAQVKLVRDVTPAHQLQFALTVGRSRLDQDPEFVSRGEVKDGVNDVGVAVITWRYLVSPRFILIQKARRRRQQHSATSTVTASSCTARGAAT